MQMGKRNAAANIKLKRDDPSAAGDHGAWILIDLLRPRWIKKLNAAVDQWAKDISLNITLRKWFTHRPLDPSPVDRPYWASHRRQKSHSLPCFRKSPHAEQKPGFD
jgi:uncharacterized protein YeaO (DUF488 family)